MELAATGVHPRRPAFTGPDALTPTERRIAERAAAGASNRDIAQPFHHTQTSRTTLGDASTASSVSPAAANYEALAT